MVFIHRLIFSMTTVTYKSLLLLETCVFFIQAANQGKVADPNVTKYNVKVLPVSSSPLGLDGT